MVSSIRIEGDGVTKRVLCTRHALTAMEERQIAAEWVERTVASPDWRETDPGDPAVTRLFRALPERDGRYPRVACVETAEEIRIP